MTEPVTASADPWPDHIRLSDIKHVSSARSAASAVPTCGRTSTPHPQESKPRYVDPYPESLGLSRFAFRVGVE